MLRLLLPLAAGLLLVSALHAQELAPLASAPQLPFGLTWTMSEKDALAALKRAGIEATLSYTGASYSEDEIRKLCARYQDGESPDLAQRLRDEKTWHIYNLDSVRIDSAFPPATCSIEFLKDHILKVYTRIVTESDSAHFALAHALDVRYRGFYGTYAVGEKKEMPRFPDGRALLSIKMVDLSSHTRPEVYYGWSGLWEKVIYGTSIYTDYRDRGAESTQELVLLHETTLEPAIALPSRRNR